MTVSRTLSNPVLVSPEARDAVMRAVGHLGYVPDRTAGSLATRKTGFVALLIPTLTNANFASVAHGITEIVRPAGYQLLIGYTSYSTEEEERQIQSLLTRRPEAIVLASSNQTRALSASLLNAGIPVIEIADLPSRPIGRVVGFSNYSAGRMAARYLLDSGFEEIAAIGCENRTDIQDTRGEERLRGFRDEVVAAAVTEPIILRQGSAPVSYTHGSSSLRFLLRSHPGVQAIFAVSDLSAIGVMMECRRHGIPVPEQLSMIGFGDFEIASEIEPGLTTVRANFRDMGVQVGDLILELLSGKKTTRPTVVDVGLSVVERGTVKGRGTAVESHPSDVPDTPAGVRRSGRL